MRKEKRRRAVLAALAATAVLLCTGCSEKPDAETYVRAALDAIYHRECGEYAELIRVSEAQAEEEIEKTFQENMSAAFSGDTVTSDEDKDAYIDTVREIYKAARYEVTGSKETENGFIVTVCVEPCMVFEHLEDGVTEKITQALEDGTYVEDRTVSYVTRYLNDALEEKEYGSQTEIEVSVTIDGDGICQISEEDLLKIENTLFPGTAQNP